MFTVKFLGVLLLIFCFPAHAMELQGSLIQGGLTIGKTSPGAKVMLEGKKTRLTDDGYFVIGFGRNHGPEALLEIHDKNGNVEKHTLAVEQREYEIQRIDGLAGNMVSPPESVWEQIQSDRTAVANARAHNTDEPYFLKGFAWPAKGPISGVYGSQRILNGKPKQPHYGVDVASPEGTPVTAPADGIVRLAHPDMYYTGQTIIIDHGYGVSSTLMHMSALHVEEGQAVKQGELIGAIGATGRATGAHLDWRMNWFDVRIDPMTVVKGLPEQ